ncbi:MAG: SH3 domain-containing protein [Tissierellia bacterium]|nr:SH3 domain-containing protein [Tissierellia bacterium]MDD4780646.1 SH3 domain-containing protein [Tissierellia bacterium]
MPSIYLSPSTQEYNPFVIGGSEEYYMNLIADAMIPILEANGIQYGRNTPDMTAGSSIRESNAGDYDLHLAIHSNASGPGQEGQNRGVVVFYYPSSANGKRFAEIIANNFRGIYPNPSLVRTLGVTNLGEVSRTRAPSVLVEVAYHDNVEDANWIVNNIDLIGQALANSVVQYFQGTLQNGNQQQGNIGTVTLQSGYLNIRQGPSLNSPVIAMAPNGSTLTILGRNGDWYNVNYNGNIGYASAQYIRV